MYNYRIEAEYDGGRYDGWQRLGKDPIKIISISYTFRTLTG